MNRLKKTQKKKFQAIQKAKTNYTERINKFIQNSQNYGRKFWSKISNNTSNQISSNNIPPLNYKNKDNITDPVKILHEAMTLPPPLPISIKYRDHHKKINNFVQKYFQSNHPNKDINSTKKDKTRQNKISTIDCPSNININLKIPKDKYSTLNNIIQQYEISSIIKKLDPIKHMDRTEFITK